MKSEKKTLSPLLDQDGASGYAETDRQEQVRRRRQSGPTLVELDDSETRAEEEDAETEWNYNFSDRDDLKDQPRPMRKNKSTAAKGLPAARQRRPPRFDAHHRYEERENDTVVVVSPVTRYLYDILGRSLNLIKMPLLVLMSLLIISVALSILSSAVKSQLCSIPGLNLVCWISGQQGDASWKCSLPGSGRLFAECRTPATPQGAREVQRLLYVHDELNEVQEAIVGQISLPLFIKRSETAMREVSKRVELSDVPSKYLFPSAPH